MRKKLLMLIFTGMLLMSTLTACGNTYAGPVNHKDDTKNETQTEAKPEETDGTVVEVGGNDANINVDTDIAPDVPDTPTSISSEEAFTMFLNNDMKASVVEKYYGFSGDEDVYLAEIINKTVGYAKYTDWFSDMELARLSYSYIDAGNDGIPELLISIWLDSENMGEVNYESVYNFDGEKINLIAYTSGGYRTIAHVNRDGIIYSGGSSGAASYADEYYVLLADGSTEILYFKYTEFAMSAPMVPTYMLSYYPDGYDVNTWEYDNPYVMMHYYFADLGDCFYFTNEDGECVMPDQEYLALYNDQNIKILNDIELEDALSDVFEKYGVNRNTYAMDNCSIVELDPNDYEGVMGKEWKEAYKAFLSDNLNFSDLLSEYHGLFLSCEPQAFVGFSLAEITGDDIPELIILGVEAGGYTETTGEEIYIYTFEPDNGKVTFLGETASLGSMPGWYDAEYMDLTGTPLKDTFNSMYCVTGLYNNQLVVFSNWGDTGYDFAVSKIFNNGGTLEQYLIYNYYVDSDWDMDGQFEVYESGELSEGIEYCENYTPLYFARINDANIEELICDDYENTILHTSSAEDVIRALTDYSLQYSEMDKSILWADGYIDEWIGYSIDNRMQFYIQ